MIKNHATLAVGCVAIKNFCLKIDNLIATHLRYSITIVKRIKTYCSVAKKIRNGIKVGS